MLICIYIIVEHTFALNHMPFSISMINYVRSNRVDVDPLYAFPLGLMATFDVLMDYDSHMVMLECFLI
jgi:hypothetical protein